jgi:hypothetical protein
MQYLRIEAERQVYAPTDVRRTMTVGELISFLQDFPEDMPVILSHDNGYTFGGINYENLIDGEYADE